MPKEFILLPVFLIAGAIIGYVFRRFTSEKLINGAEQRKKKWNSKIGTSFNC